MRSSLSAALVLFFFFLVDTLTAQIKADFTFSKNAGCSPLVVSFTNASSGLSSSATFEWSFGNGNRSLLKDAGAVFQEPGNYTITLTVKDGSQSSTQSKQITVYRNPEVEFSSSLSKGCAPLSVTFIADAKPGDGTVSSYSWDFGDGNTTSTSSSTSVHTYNSDQLASVSVTVANSYGCYTTLEKKDLLDVKPKLVPDFKPENNFICKIDDPVKLENKSTGPGQLSYQWDFGDGKTSQEISPTHVFNKSGAFTVKLTVNSSEGCTATQTKTNVLNVANFKTDVAIPSTVCKNAFYYFKNLSHPTADSFTWFIDDMQIYGQARDSVGYGFSTEGTHKIRLENKFGNCQVSVEKEVAVRSLLNVAGFVAEQNVPCGIPVSYTLKDTTKGAVGWAWNQFFEFANTRQADVKLYPGNNWINLTVRDSAGCATQVRQDVYVTDFQAKIVAPDYPPNTLIELCEKGEVRFKVESNQKIIAYAWNFKTVTSTLAEPKISFDNVVGDFSPYVTITNEHGCDYMIASNFMISSRDKPEADFTVVNNTICGNTPVEFSGSIKVPSGITNGLSVMYKFGDGGINTFRYNGNAGTTHKYSDSGHYTVEMIVTNGACADTVTKSNFIQVVAPIPAITAIPTNCNGNRGAVTIEYEAKSATSGTWDFGDGTTAPIVPGDRRMNHEYSKSGEYKVVLSATNGSCTVKDSMMVNILRKQDPIFTLDRSEVCQNYQDAVIRVSNLDLPDPLVNIYNKSYYVYLEDNTGKRVLAEGANGRFYSTSSQWELRNFSQRLDGAQVRMILYVPYFGCYDTSNWVALKVSGPLADFKINEQPCPEKNAVSFLDISTQTHKILTREWNFGDNTVLATDKIQVDHTYAYSGYWPVKLTVTDEKGCKSDITRAVPSTNSVLSASFASSSALISPGSSVNFTNTSITDDPLNTSYTWLFGDGTTSSEKNPSKQFTQSGIYTVKLIATQATKSCSDTASQTVEVKFINTTFTINTRYITASKCPPVLVQFNNTSSNISRIFWDFGDGGTSTVFNPSHIYIKAGIYVVNVKSYSDNGTEYRTTDTVKIEAPMVQLTADSLTGCTNQRTSFKAIAQHALNYTWDFGDGTVLNSSDSVARYNYMNSGVFRPKLIVTDVNGCSVAASLKDSVVIDSLNIRLTGLPGQICVPRSVEFSSIAATAVAGQRLDYLWKFGIANGDSSSQEKPTFNYNQTGKFLVQLTVRTSFGCVRTVSQEIQANQGLGAVINGPAEVCEGTEASFTASTQVQGSPKWTWLFPDGSVSTLQNPGALKFMQVGDFQVKLVADNVGCRDTLIKDIKVNAKPTAAIKDRNLQICNGSSVDLRAQGGVAYKWTPVSGLNKDTGSIVLASPQQTVYYAVAVTNDKGCTGKDSVQVKVVQKQKVVLAPELSICSGTSAKLPASGTDKYIWIGNTSGLSSSSIADPTASPLSSTTYRVVGSDAAGCFSDTASINVIVNTSPTVDAGVGADISAGSSYPLNPTASPDVTKYLWSPDRNLSCVTCLAPVASPTESVTYTLKVTNDKGCSATDTVTVDVMCTESKIYIPNIFTPNGDGKNDLFSIKGAGIKSVRSFRIFDRWGKMIFEKTNFQVNDPSGSWNGRINGVNVPVGSYIYMAELTCDGSTFTRKGTVSVIY